MVRAASNLQGGPTLGRGDSKLKAADEGDLSLPMKATCKRDRFDLARQQHHAGEQ